MRVVCMRQPVRPRHILRFLYGIYPEIGEATIIFFANFDNRMPDFMAQNERPVCQRSSRGTFGIALLISFVLRSRQ